MCTALLSATSALSTVSAAESSKSKPVADEGIIFDEICYEATVTDSEARFQADITVESASKQETAAVLFDGELALLPPKLPSPLRLAREGDQYGLFISKPGRYQFKLDLVAKVKHAEPWNLVSFKGPVAAIASVAAQASGADVDLQLMSGTLLACTQTNGVARVKGFLGADQTVALRWSRAGGMADVARKAVVTAETSATAQITPTVVKYVTQVHFDIIQGKLPNLTISLPASHALTRLTGEQIRDWEIKPNSGDGKQLLEIQFIKPLEKQYDFTLFSEQTVEAMPSTASLVPPQPLDIERESGSFTVTTEDTLAEVESASGLRQMNAPAGALTAYRFNGRPFTLVLGLRRIEPVISAAERVSARVEETRLLSSHTLTLNVEKAGIYALDLIPPAGFLVADVRGQGVEDWKLGEPSAEGVRTLRVNFSSRVLGSWKLEVQLEQSLKNFPEQISLGPLRVAGAAREISEIGAASAAGIRLKTAELSGLREIPARTLQSRAGAAQGPPSDELLGYRAEQPDWKLSLATEKLAARVVAEIFNLITIGDGLVGGSATIRYGFINQGVQEFEISVPAAWKNVEFTGPNIRRKEQKADGTWTIGLQDKAWGGYTLVVTYDFQFDPKGATLPLGGIHTLGVERETGSVAVTTAASLKLNAKSASDSIRPVDELELSAADRSLITRSVLLAYQYNQSNYALDLEVKRFQETTVLSAVADRTQLTTVLTDAGEMLTQASFMVKNNDKQFQRFKLPKGADFWSCHVNGQPVKAEKDGEWLMAPLPRGANRDQAFAVDIVYKENKGVKLTWHPRAFLLEAPQTDVPNTYAEWQLFAPAIYRLSGFAGNMTPVRGTTYDLQDAWQKLTRFYWEFLHEFGPGLLGAATVVVLLVALIGSAIRRGASGVLSVLVVFAIIAILAAMLLPALSRAKSRAQRINAVNSLKQIGLAARTFAMDNNDRLPNSYEEMMNELSTDKVTYDPETGQRFIWLGSGLEFGKIQPDSVIAYTPGDGASGRAVLLADGSVQQMSRARFEELARRGFIVPATAQQIAQNQQIAAVNSAQFQPATAQPLANIRPAVQTPAITVPGQTVAAAAPLPAAPRVRSIRIDIPREGQSFTFTKVLNVGREPLGVQVGIMKLRTFQKLQMIFQLSAFVAGLLVFAWQWRRIRNTFILSLGLALSLGAVGNLLLAWRLLHLAFIWVAPILFLALLAWLTWRFWPRPQPKPAPAAETGFEPGLPPAMAVIAFGIFSLAAASNSSAAHSAPEQAPAHPLLAERAEVRETAISANQTGLDFHGADRPSSVSILSATYTGFVNEHVAQLDAVLRVSTSQPGQKLDLFGDDVAVQQFSSKPSDVRLVREANAVAVILSRRGEATLQLKLLVKLGGDITRRQLAFAIPGALTSQLAFTIEQPDADLEFPAAISARRVTAGQQTRVEAVMGSGNRVELLWTPRVKRAAEIAANVICHNATLVTFGSGVLNARAILDYQVTQGEMRQAHVRLPDGHRLLRVEGEVIRSWEVKTENGEQTLIVDLLKGVAPGYRLTVETERLLEALPAVVPTDIPHAVGVKRETGLVALRGDEELELAVEKSAELYRVDLEEFGRVTGQKSDGTVNAFRFLKPDFILQTKVAAMQPQIEAVVKNSVRIGQEQVNLNASLDYTIKRAGVFSLKLGLPSGYRLETVTGLTVLQWAERKEGDQRLVEVTFKERVGGAYNLQLALVQPLKGFPKTMPILGVHPLAARKLTGFVSISVEPGVAVKPAGFNGLSEVPAGSIGGNESSAAGSVLAYKFLAGEPQAAAGWSLSVATETVESWMRAEIVNTLTLSDTLVSGRAIARFEIQNAPVKELRLRIPGEFRNVEISAPNIRRRDHDGELWRVEFQSKIRGPHNLSVTWEQPRKSTTNYVELQGISAENVERETGIFAIVARPPLQITEQNAGDLKPIDLRDLPEWAGAPDESTVLAYRYLRPGLKLGVEAKRFDEAEVLQALVENLNLSTVVADDGQMMTQMSLSVRNQGRQHLEIGLPPDARVWSAFVAGQAVRPSVKEGKLLLPLEHSVGDDSPIAIELVYIGTNAFPKKYGKVELISPQLDAPLKSARWELFLPPDYQYSRFAGTMAHEVETAMVEASNFSALDYLALEWKSKKESAQELKSEITSAKKKLSTGNVKDAMADYNRARYRGDLAAAKDNEAKELEADLRRAQGSNLIQAQNSFTLNNGSMTETQTVVAGNLVQYDAAAAEAQWTKLQQAQDLGMANVQPIRVNLPTRGLRHSFTQVLQTEIGKPMTIQLLADNVRDIGWAKRLLGPIMGFLLLWALVAFIVNRPSLIKRTNAAAA
jgi:type II secretory pathway pseudopilin PulG